MNRVRKILPLLLLAAVLRPARAANVSENERRYREATMVETGDRDLERAASLYRDLIGRTQDPRLAARANFRLGQTLERLNRTDQAIAAYEAVAKADGAAERDVSDSARDALRRLKEAKERQEKDRLAALYRSGATLAPPVRRVRTTVSLDYVGAGNVLSAYANAYQDMINFLESVGTNAHAHLTADPGYGLRVGFLIPLKQAPRVRFGASAGYVVGPEIRGSLDADDGSTLDLHARSRFYRFLAEGEVSRRLTRRTSLQLGAGLGVALGRLTLDTASSGNITGDGLSSDAVNTTDVTWEIGPALLVDLSSVEFEIGVRFEAYPAFHIADGFTSVWQDFGAHVGVRF